MNHAALPTRLRQVLRGALHEPAAGVGDDQLHALEALLAAANVRDLRVTTCDGDSPPDERRWAREYADVVLTNPDFLHFAVLPQHERWSRLLSSLASQVTDAIFGTNPQNHGTITFGSTIVVFDRNSTSIDLTITDTTTGQVTLISVPQLITSP